jgi:hypothetical protein
MSNLVYRSLLITVALCFLNFLAFMAVAGNIGGDALNGKIVDGHFFLGSHGHFTEVTQAVFNYSAWHARSVFFTHPLAFLLGAIAGIEFKSRNAAMPSSTGK